MTSGLAVAQISMAIMSAPALASATAMARPIPRRARHDGRFAFETEVRRGSSVVRARFGRVSLFVAQQCRSCDGSCRCYDHFTSRDSSIALFWFPVCQRHVLTRKSFAFHMKLFRMMRQRHVSFFADALGRRSEWMPASDYSIRESALFRSVPKIFYPIVRSHDFPVLPGNDVAQRRGETILQRLFVFVHSRIFPALAFGKDRMIVSAGSSGFQVDPGAMHCTCGAAGFFGLRFTQALRLILQLGREPRTLL